MGFLKIEMPVMIDMPISSPTLLTKSVLSKIAFAIPDVEILWKGNKRGINFYIFRNTDNSSPSPEFSRTHDDTYAGYAVGITSSCHWPTFRVFSQGEYYCREVPFSDVEYLLSSQLCIK